MGEHKVRLYGWVGDGRTQGSPLRLGWLVGLGLGEHEVRPYGMVYRMAYDPARHHRRSIRLRHFDYSLPGVYFVTLVVRRRLSLWGEIVDGEMQLNDAGAMVAAQWQILSERFPFCEPSTFVVMPNHFHGLLIFKSIPPDPGPKTSESSPSGTLKKSLGRVMQAFKSLTTNEYIQGVRQQDWPPFEKQVWLRNYWERIVRDEREWRAAHEYIEQNPARWQFDKHHPSNTRANGA